MIRFSSLSSSSTYGNAYLIAGPGGTLVLVDCGGRHRRLAADLRSLGVDAARISAVLLTHEHADHTYCLTLRSPFMARHGIPVHAHALVWEHCPTAQAYRRAHGDGALARELEVGRELQIGSLTVTPFPTPHDALRPLGFVFACDGERVGLATDLGHVNRAVADRLSDCDGLILESNHDRQMELASGRPPYLIERVLGDRGHLANEQAAAALPELVAGRTRAVMLAHLSLDCNLPALAMAVSEARLSSAGWRGRLVTAPPRGPSGWLNE